MFFVRNSSGRTESRIGINHLMTPQNRFLVKHMMLCFEKEPLVVTLMYMNHFKNILSKTIKIIPWGF